MPPSEKEKEAPLLWDFVPIAEYKPPAAPVSHSVRARLNFFRRLFGRDEKEQEPPLEGTENIQAMPDWQLDCISPSPEWHDPAAALDVELKDWLAQEKPVSSIVVMVGPPHNGHCQTLTAWAQRQQWPLLSPPTAAQILAGEDTWLTQQIVDDTPWVLPCLERTYLRHPEGLTVVRRFLANAYAGNLGRGIIGCDSWAWAFLRHAWRGRVPVTVTLSRPSTKPARRGTSATWPMLPETGRCAFFNQTTDETSCRRQMPERPPVKPTIFCSSWRPTVGVYAGLPGRSGEPTCSPNRMRN